MARRKGLALAALACFTACGEGAAPLDTTRQIWLQLRQLGISSPLTPDPWLQLALQPLAGNCQLSGRLVVSMVHTDAFEGAEDSVDVALPPNGQTTGHVVYGLAACANVPELALSGTLRRTFHAVQQYDAEPTEGGGALEKRLASQESDAYYGVLSVKGRREFACHIDMMRTLGWSAPDGQTWVNWQGTVCGHDAATVSKD